MRLGVVKARGWRGVQRAVPKMLGRVLLADFPGERWSTKNAVRPSRGEEAPGGKGGTHDNMITHVIVIDR